MKEPTARYTLISDNFCKDTHKIINKANLFLFFLFFLSIIYFLFPYRKKHPPVHLLFVFGLF